MNHFAKFLDQYESLICVSAIKKTNWSFYFVFFVVFPFIFFLLYPMSVQGRRGFFIWLSLIFLALMFLIKIFEKADSLYLLTNRRLLFLEKNKLDYKLSGAISLTKIYKIKKIGSHDISLWFKNKRFDLVKLENRDVIYQKIIKLKQV